MLRAAMYSPESNQRMGRIVVGLGPDVARTIAAAMQEMEEADAQGQEAGGRHDYEATPEVGTPVEPADEQVAVSSVERLSPGRDPELEQEEKLIRAFKTIKDLQDSNAKAAAELEELRQDRTDLQQAFDAFKYDVENEGRMQVENDSVRSLQAKADHDRDYIAELEAELDSLRTTSQAQERQLERDKADSDVKQKLRDDLQLLRAEKDELLQKSRTNENLKKKIQALQDQEKASANLKEDLKAANDQLHLLDQFKEQCAILQKANAENMTTIANGEQEIFDQKTTRKRMEHEYKVLVQKWESSRDKQSRDHETIAELENKIQALELGRSASRAENHGLENEMAVSEKNKSGLDDKSLGDAVSADASILRQKLEAITTRNHKLETDYLDILQDKLGLETTIQDLREPTREPEENVPFLEQRKRLQDVQSEVADLKNQHFTTVAELSRLTEKLLAAERHFDGRDVGSLDSDTEYQALESRYAELYHHSLGIEAELSEHRSLLRHALLSSSALLKEPADVRQGNEYKLTLQQMQIVRSDPTDDEILESTATNLAGRINNAISASLAANKVRVICAAYKQPLFVY